MTNVQIYGAVAIGSALLIKRVVRYLAYRWTCRYRHGGLSSFLSRDIVFLFLWLVLLAAQCLLLLGIGLLLLELFNRHASI